MSTILLKQKDYEELSQSIFDLNLKVMEKDKEIERLNNIINKIDTYVNKMRYYADEDDKEYIISKEIHNIMQELNDRK